MLYSQKGLVMAWDVEKWKVVDPQWQPALAKALDRLSDDMENLWFWHGWLATEKWNRIYNSLFEMSILCQHVHPKTKILVDAVVRAERIITDQQGEWWD